MRVIPAFISILLSGTCFTCLAQDSLPIVDRVIDFPTRFMDRLQKRSSNIEDQLISKTEKYLKRLSRQEQRIYAKLRKIDSSSAETVFAGSQEKYAHFIRQINDSLHQDVRFSGEYLPYLDSIGASLSFLDQNKELINSSTDISNKLTNSLEQFKDLQARLNEAEDIKLFIRERKELIRQTLDRYTQLPPGLKNEFDRMNKEIYYYTQQVREYRAMLNDPDKLTLKALSLLNKIPAFAEFLKEHAQLAGLFSIPGAYGSPQGVSGLQTTAQVQQIIMNQAGSGPNALSAIQQSVQAAQAQLDLLKDKINQLGGGSGDIEMPNFKPNNEKVKTFWKRLEYGTNLQSTRANNFYPSSSELGLSMGYKLSDKSSLGIGLSYRVGWGQDISHIVVTSEGIGLRSYFDMKLKGSFFASGGYEYNYQEPFNSFNQLEELDDWQQSGLVGITKIISLKSKVFKKTKVQLLWDFLSYHQNPVTQAFKFRVGYNF